MFIDRIQFTNVEKLITPNKVVALFGARRTGKTTILKKLAAKISEKKMFISGDDIQTKNFLESQSIQKLKDFIGDYRYLFIDEAQNFKEIGLNLKIIVDNIEDIRVIATGSSSFDLSNKLGEPLTGRKFSLVLYPISQAELSTKESLLDTQTNLENRLIYGSYPEVVTAKSNQMQRTLLNEIVSSYLYKDILQIEGIKKSDKIIRLLQLIAFQIGKEVSYQELGKQLSISKNTAERYLDLLEKTFVLKRIRGFSRNLRKEISKNSRYYFYDNGVRNALINNYNPINIRDDIGQLWENYLIMERIKKQEYKRINQNNYFWRTYDQKEIDFIEERNGCLYGYEIKWGSKVKDKSSHLWLKTYKNSEYRIINRDNYLDFII